MTDITLTQGARAPGNGTNFNATAGTTFPIGTPVVQDPTASQVLPGQATDAVASRLLGIAASAGAEGGPVRVQFTGPLELTTDQWDEITGGTGGLTRGRPYFLSAVLGGLTLTPPAIPGQFVVSVGVATSPRELMVLITPAPDPI